MDNTKREDKHCALGIPSNGTVKLKTLKCITRLTTPVTVLTNESPYVHLNRQRIAQQAKGFTHLLFVDTDMFFEPDALERLLAHDKDIIGAEYNYRQLPLKTTRQGGEKVGNLLKCDVMGTGFLLIKTSVFEKLPQPWFFYKHDGDEIIEGDDVWFCNRAKEAGFDIWCDPEVKIFHIGEFLF